MDLRSYRIKLKAAARAAIDAGRPLTVAEGKNPGAAMGSKWQLQQLTVERAGALIDAVDHPTIGMRLGPAGGVIDFDIDGPDELRAFDALHEGVDGLPQYPTYDSGREGGEHRWAAFDERLTVTGAATIKYTSPAGDSITVRIGANGKGAHSVMPPSRHAQKSSDKLETWAWSGQRYAWRPGCDLETLGLPKLPEPVVERLLAAHGANGSKSRKTAPAPAPSKPAGGDDGVHAAALAAMLGTTKDMVDNADGSKRLYCVACRAVEHDLSDAQAVATINKYAAQTPFLKPYSASEILDRVRDAEKEAERGSAVLIANFEEIVAEDDGTTSEKARKIITVPKAMGQIIDEINARTDNWPRRVSNMLFVDDPTHGIDYFDRRTTAGLFGWLRRRAAVKWAKGGSFVAQAELFAEIERTTKRYDAIEVLPHEPMIPGIYYRGVAPPPGDGSHLRSLLDRFRPETTVDRTLIQAAFMTAFWGGASGRRPAFVFTSDDGRGVGKTTVAEMIARLCGGFIDVSANEDIETIKTRILTPSARTTRVALLDNLKTMRLSWAELESLITSPVISGRQLYVGEGQRPNLLTWCLTLNGVSMATDMAQRSVIIKVVRGTNAGPWYDETTAYIDQNREAIIGDIIGALRGERHSLASYSRWATWEKDVLCRLPAPDEIQRVILERQGEANCELDEAEIIEQYFADELTKYSYRPQTDRVRIPVSVVASWFSKAVGEQTRTASASKRLHQLATESLITRLAREPSRTHGRCFVWTGPAADICSQPIANDLQERMARNQNCHR